MFPGVLRGSVRQPRLAAAAAASNDLGSVLSGRADEQAHRTSIWISGYKFFCPHPFHKGAGGTARVWKTGIQYRQGLRPPARLAH